MPARILTGPLFAGLLVTSAIASAGDDEPAPGSLALYVSALVNDSIVKLVDLDGDNRYDGPGETSVFFGPNNGAGFPGVGSAQTILVLRYDELLAGDGESSGGFTKRVYRLRDADNDGTAMGPGDSSVFWNGDLPGYPGGIVDRPKDITIGPDGAIYLADNNTINFSGDTPEAVWRLEDLDENGVIDSAAPGEVLLHKELCPPGDAFCFITEDYKWNNAGQLFFSNQTSSSNNTNIWILEPDGSLTPFCSDDDLLGLGLTKVGMTLRPQTENPVMAAFDILENRRIVEFVDFNGNGFIDDNDETRLLYRSDTSAEQLIWGLPNGAMDIDYAPDGSLWLLDLNTDRVLRFVDLDGDGMFQSVGEATVAYDPQVAASNGGVVIDFPRTIGFAVVPDAGVPGDVTGDGVVDLADLNLVLANFGTGGSEGDATGDGQVDLADLNLVLANFGDG